MRKSKLESYQEILEALSEKLLTIDALSYETDIDCALLRQRLGFLMKNGLVVERMSHKKAVFAVLERGRAVLKALTVQKQLEKVKETIVAADETAQIMPIASRRRSETE
jgi:predicted transcriptional regulator